MGSWGVVQLLLDAEAEAEAEADNAALHATSNEDNRDSRRRSGLRTA